MRAVWICDCGNKIEAFGCTWAWCKCGRFAALDAKMSRPHVRTAEQRVLATAQAFEETQRAMWSSLWPFGHRAVSSLLLVPLLRCADELSDWRVAIGVAAWTTNAIVRWKYDWFPKEPLRHAWCESAAGDIIDPTYGQFDHGEALKILPPHLAGDLGHYAHKILTLDEEDAARRSISPERSQDGWHGGVTSGVKKMFEMIDKGM